MKPFDRMLQRPVPLVHPDGQRWDKDEIGRFGEDASTRWLWVKKGCRILYRNFRAVEGGEVDIVCRDGNTLCFIEVKARTSDRFGRPADAVTMDKRFLIFRGAREWLRLLNRRGEILFRFDIMEVMITEGQPPRFNWIQNAFQFPEVEKW